MMLAISTGAVPIPGIGRPGNQSGALRRALAVAAAAVLLPLLTLAGCAPAVSRRGPVELEHDRAALDRFLADERDASGLPGMAVAVVGGRDVVYVPDSGYGFVVMYNANSALADTAAIKASLAAYLSGQGSAMSARSSWTIRFVFLGLSLATLGAAVRILARRRVEADRDVHGPRWRVAGRAVWLLAPVAVLVGLPWLILALADRWFTRWQLSLAMPDVTIFLVVAAVSGAVVNAARLRR